MLMFRVSMAPAQVGQFNFVRPPDFDFHEQFAARPQIARWRLMAETREKLKKAAATLFLKKGYAKTSIGEIEAKAGLAPRAGSFYRHFKSKKALLVEIAKTEISEQPQEFDFDTISSLGNTRAELMLIGQIFERASERQKPFLRLIEELRQMKFGQKVEQNVNQEMMTALAGWVSSKPVAKPLSAEQVNVLTMLVFGGWLFYLTKSQQGVHVDGLDQLQLLNTWADHWAAHLDNA